MYSIQSFWLTIPSQCRFIWFECATCCLPLISLISSLMTYFWNQLKNNIVLMTYSWNEKKSFTLILAFSRSCRCGCHTQPPPSSLTARLFLFNTYCHAHSSWNNIWICTWKKRGKKRWGWNCIFTKLVQGIRQVLTVCVVVYLLNCLIAVVSGTNDW